jgi:tripartite-type tricarboxylate transporter receptor subunit TctC
MSGLITEQDREVDVILVRTCLTMALCAGLLLPTATAVDAQAYPNKPIKMVVPFPAGGPTDGMARIISDRLGQVLGQSIVIENKGGGAGGSVGAKFVASADPDGYTILITPGGSLTTGPAVHKNIGYDPLRAFTPVALLIQSAQVMSVHPDVPVKSFAELVSYAKANPGKLSWGSQGFGTSPHLLVELFKLETGANILHVPYRGTAPMLAAILAGEIQVVSDTSTTSLPHIQAGKLRPIAVPLAERFSKLPDVPTTAELGYPKLLAPFWLGVVAPAGTPPNIIARLNAALRESLSPPDTQTRLANLGAEIRIGAPADFGKLITDELALWTSVAKAANIQVD